MPVHDRAETYRGWIGRALWGTWPLAAFLAVYAAFAALTFRQYGITWDEPAEYISGNILWHYLRSGMSYEEYRLTMRQDGGRMVYNYGYSLLLNTLAGGGAVDYTRFHLYNFIFATPIFVAAYALLLKQYRNPLLAVLGPVCLLLTPQLLGHIPSNPKDVPFAVGFFVSLAAIYILPVQRHTALRMVVLGVLFGLTQSIRLVGYALYIVLVGFELYMFWLRRERGWLRFGLELGTRMLGIVLIAHYMMVITWPYVGSAYSRNLRDVILQAQNYPWDRMVRFMGADITSQGYPWYYLPVWIAITTPTVMLALFVASLCTRPNPKNALRMLVYGASILVAVLYVVLRPAIYDGPRHFLFLIVLISFIAAIGGVEVFQRVRGRWRAAFGGLLGGCALMLVAQLWLIHPYEYIYFNELVGSLPGAYTRYETDYWGAANKEAIAWLAQHELLPERTYAITTCGSPAAAQFYFRPNMVWAETIADADYYVCFTRWNQHLATSQGQVVHVVERAGTPLVFIRRLR